MKVIQLKKLPKWDCRCPLKVLNEKEAIAWAKGKGATMLYRWGRGKLWLIKD
jgi:hypothetical protein